MNHARAARRRSRIIFWHAARSRIFYAWHDHTLSFGTQHDRASLTRGANFILAHRRLCGACCRIVRRKAQPRPASPQVRIILAQSGFRHAIAWSQTATMQNCTWAFVLQISRHARQANTPAVSPACAVARHFISARCDLKFRSAAANLKFQSPKRSKILKFKFCRAL